MFLAQSKETEERRELKERAGEGGMEGRGKRGEEMRDSKKEREMLLMTLKLTEKQQPNYRCRTVLCLSICLCFSLFTLRTCDDRSPWSEESQA